MPGQAGITLDQAQAQLNTWLAANTAVAAGQAYEMQGRRLTRVNSKEILDQVVFWNKLVQGLSRSAPARVMRQITFRG